MRRFSFEPPLLVMTTVITVGAEAPLPPAGRTPPDAHKLALLRELSTFTTWRVQLPVLVSAFA